MSRDRLVGGGFQSHAITGDKMPGDADAAHDNRRHECHDREQPVVYEWSVVEIELPVCALLDLRVFLKRMGLPGRICEIEPFRAELHRIFRARHLLVGQPEANILSGVIDVRSPYQPLDIDAGHPDAEQKHRVAQHHHHDADAGREPPNFLGPQLGRSTGLGRVRGTN